MRLTKKRRRPGCEINITPLIDIVFLLIIFSMVVSQFTKLQAEKIELPSARSGADERRSEGARIVVNVLPNAHVVVSGERQTTESLAGLLAAEAAERGADNVSVVIRSDRRTPWRAVAVILQLCANERIERVKVAVAEPEEAAEP